MVILVTPAGTLILDAALSICETLTATLTEHPIETGATITDHVIAKPKTIRVEGIFTENPLDAVADPEWPVAAKDLLKEAHATRDLCTVSDETATYEKMVMETLEFPRDGKTGCATVFSATFKEARLVASRTVAVQKSQKPAKQSKGKQATKSIDRSTEQKAKSTFKASVDSLTKRKPQVVNPE